MKYCPAKENSLTATHQQSSSRRPAQKAGAGGCGSTPSGVPEGAGEMPSCCPGEHRALLSGCPHRRGSGTGGARGHLSQGVEAAQPLLCLSNLPKKISAQTETFPATSILRRAGCVASGLALRILPTETQQHQHHSQGGKKQSKAKQHHDRPSTNAVGKVNTQQSEVSCAVRVGPERTGNHCFLPAEEAPIECP